MSTSEFDQLLSQDGILMVGRFGPGWTVADHKCKGLFVESPAALEMARSFCPAITMVFNSLAFAADSITRTGFDPSTWLPQRGWAFTGWPVFRRVEWRVVAALGRCAWRADRRGA
jgi:roadblock/LC7 domain-containing protein